MNKGQLGAALRALRQASGMEAKAVARGAAMSASKLSKIETGKLAPSVIDVEQILRTIGVSEEVKAEYMAVARAAATEATAWRLIGRLGFHRKQQQTQALEAQMAVLRLFQPALVPGLLQTPEYIHAVLSRHGDMTSEAVARTTSARLERQRVLYDASKRFRFIITEPVLRWCIVPPAVMAGQLDRIISASRLNHVDIRVVPLAGAKQDIANHAFVIRDERTVTVETVHAEVIVTDPRDIELYARKFEGFASMALSGDAMRAMVESIRDDFLREQETG
ncbi:helix-turn-helix domain-containing protein [Streptomyces sp. NPDC002577]